MKSVIVSIIMFAIVVALIIAVVLPISHQIKDTGQHTFDAVKTMNSNITAN